MTRTTWRSICHARAVTIALSLVRQSMDLGRAIRTGAFRETKILTGLPKIFRGLTSMSSPFRKLRRHFVLKILPFNRQLFFIKEFYTRVTYFRLIYY